MTARWNRFFIAASPAALFIVGALIIAGVLGGPLAVVLTGALLVSALLLDMLLLGLLVTLTAVAKRHHLLWMGVAAYAGACVVVILLWGLFGPSQIM